MNQLRLPLRVCKILSSAVAKDKFVSFVGAIATFVREVALETAAIIRELEERAFSVPVLQGRRGLEAALLRLPIITKFTNAGEMDPHSPLLQPSPRPYRYTSTFRLTRVPMATTSRLFDGDNE